MLEMVQKAGPKSLRGNSLRFCQMMAESKGAGEKSSQDCWNLMTRAEKLLLFLLTLTLLVLVTLSAFIIVHFLTEKVCDSHNCIEASSKLLQAIDFDTDPCVDFHKFLCGNYIPTYENQISLRKADLVGDPLGDDDSGLLVMVKKFYQACANETAIEDDSENTLSTLISQLGGWPLLLGKDWNEEDYNWQRFMAQVRPWGVKSDWLITFDYYEDETGTNLFMIKPPNLTSISHRFKRDYYEDSIIQLVDKLGVADFARGQLIQMIDFEGKLSHISESAGEDLTESGDYRKVTVGKLNEIWKENWLVEILNRLARGYAVFTNSTTVVVASENYLYELHKLLMATPKRTQANYFIWKIVEVYLPFSSEDIRNTYSRYLNLPSREDHCHAETLKRFHSAVEEEYISKYKNEGTVPLLTSITNLVYRSYSENEEEEANVVIEGPGGKLAGVTDISFTSNKIIRMINEVQFRVENEFYKCLHRDSGSCIREGYYDESEDLKPYFDVSENTIHLPYKLVYSDSFKWDQPNYINFARIGRTIGDKIIEAEEEDTNSTINEVGVSLCYNGYTTWVQQNGIEQRLPALNYTINQLFWIHSSLMYCSSDVDDLYKFEQVANSQYFKEDFQCQ